jgi:signal transduction histidine kinase/DNA-binding response OmpR family regulator
MQAEQHIDKFFSRIRGVWQHLSPPGLLSQPTTLLGLAMIVCCWVSLGFELAMEYGKTLENATQRVNSLAKQFEDHANDVIRNIDKVILFVREAYQADPEHFDLARLVRQTRSVGGDTTQISIVGADGYVIASTIESFRAPVYVGDRDHFQNQTEATSDDLVVGEPTLGHVTGAVSNRLSRRIVRPDGSFGGVVVAFLDPDFINRYFANIDLEPHVTATLRRSDQMVLAVHGLPDRLLGRTEIAPALREAIEREQRGAIWSAGAFDGITRIVGFRQSSEYPIISFTALDEDDVLAEYRLHKPFYVAIAVLVTTAVLWVIVVNARRQLRLAQSEKALREKSREQELTFQRMNQGLTMFDAEGRLVVWNDRYVQMYELPPELAKRGTPFIEFMEYAKRKGNFEGDPMAFSAGFQRSMQEGKIKRYLRKLHTGQKIALVSTPVEGGGWVATFEDVSELIATKEAAEQSSKAKGQFLANMSHEVRTPMNGVLGMADLLRQTKLTSEQQKFVDTIYRSARSLLQVINDILDFSKIEAGHLTIESNPFSPDQVVLDVAALLVPAAESKGVSLRTVGITRAPEGKEQISVKGDAGRLWQILNNLAGNAVKFTAKGTITLALAREGAGEGRQKLIFTVRDTGIGMPRDVMERLFSPFSQGDTSTTRKYGGTGLGLSICKRLVELMGGEIDVQSVVGIGTTVAVSIVLPTCTVEEAATAPLPTDDVPSVTRVLVAEDNPTNQEVVTQMLAKLGVTYGLAKDGQDAIEALQRRDYDLIFMDWQMSRMDGLEATRRIRQGEAGDKNRGIRIIAMTANAMTGDREKCLAAGMDDHLAKPISIMGLKRSLSRWSLHRHQPAPPIVPEADQDQVPLFDEKGVLESFDNDRELIRKVISSALSSIPDYLESFASAVNRQRWEDAQKVAHTMKGLAAQIGGARLSIQFRQIETRLREGEHLNEDIIKKVRTEFDELKTALAI